MRGERGGRGEGERGEGREGEEGKGEEQGFVMRTYHRFSQCCNMLISNIHIAEKGKVTFTDH